MVARVLRVEHLEIVDPLMAAQAAPGGSSGDVFAGSGGSGGDAPGGPGSPGGDAIFNCGGGGKSADCFEAGG